MRLAGFILIISIFFFPLTGNAQSDSISQPKNKYKKAVVLAGTGGFAVGSLVALNQVWYNEYNTGSFHFFNDNKEWLQMDKAGHFYTSYHASRLLMEAFEWGGFNRKQKIWIGGGLGFAYLTAIEIMDGYSRGWGYSWGDQLADVFGSALAMSQEAIWREQRILLKFSYAESGLAKYNPDLLGKSFGSKLIKDYNAQTYWISMGGPLFTPKSKGPLRWLAVSFGYSAYGMLGGHYNRLLAQEENGDVYKVERERRYYLSLDVDFTRIKTRSKMLRTFFSVVNLLKFPAPAVEFSKSGVKFLPIYL
jgi:hypothetical protein